MTKYIKNPTQIKNLIGVAVGTSMVQLLESFGEVHKLSVSSMVKEVIMSVSIALIADKIANIKYLNELLGEDEWAAIIDGVRRRIDTCNND